MGVLFLTVIKQATLIIITIESINLSRMFLSIKLIILDINYLSVDLILLNLN